MRRAKRWVKFPTSAGRCDRTRRGTGRSLRTEREQPPGVREGDGVLGVAEQARVDSGLCDYGLRIGAELLEETRNGEEGGHSQTAFLYQG